MAYTVNQLRNEKQTSVFGRRIGLDRQDFLVGPSGLRLAVEDISSTVPTTAGIANITRVKTSGSSQGPTQHFLPSPAKLIGMRKVIAMTSTSTGSQQFLSTANGASIFPATLGTTVGVVNFIGPAGTIVLRAISASEWAVEHMTGAFTFSTST